jgi:hypothetical protein
LKHVSFLDVKFVTFHLPNNYWDEFHTWETLFHDTFHFDTGASGFGSGQLLREWELDFVEPAERKALLRILRDEIKRRGWSVAVLGNRAEIYTG